MFRNACENINRKVELTCSARLHTYDFKMDNRSALLSENNLSIRNDRSLDQSLHIQNESVRRNRCISADNYDRVFSKLSKLNANESMNCARLRRYDSVASSEFRYFQVKKYVETSVLRRSLSFIRKSIRRRKSRSHRFRYMKKVSLSEYSDRSDGTISSSHIANDVGQQNRR